MSKIGNTGISSLGAYILTGECTAEKLKKTIAVLVYRHVYIIWSYYDFSVGMSVYVLIVGVIC